MEKFDIENYSLEDHRNLGAELVELKPVHEEVLEFIEDFKEMDEELFDLEMQEREWQGIYLRGNCFFFASQLKKAFSNSAMWFTDTVSHAVVEIEGLFFDVRGVITENMNFNEYVPSTPLLELMGRCWSHDFDAGRAGGSLYKPTLLEAIAKPVERFFLEEGLSETDEYILDLVQNFITGTLADEEELDFDAIMENGWL